MREVGNRRQQPPTLLLDAIQLDLQLFDLLGAEFVRLEDRLGVESLALGARDLVAGRVLLALEALNLRNHPTAVRFQRGQLFELVG